MISQKDLKILVLLLEAAEKEKRVSIEELAERLGLSVRTVRNNLERIDYYLKNNGFPILERDRKSGILLGIPREELEAAKKKLLQMNRETYVFSKEERILYLKMLLFEAEDYLTYDQLSETLFVSRKTVIDDVHQVKEDCEAWEIRVTGTKKGLKSLGTENARRSCLTDSLLGMFTPLELWEILRDIYPNKSSIIEKTWNEIAGSEHVVLCEKCLREAENEVKQTVTDAQYYMVIGLCAFVLSRRERGKEALPETACMEAPRYLKAYYEKLEEILPGFGPEEQVWILNELDRIFHLENLERSESLSMAMTEQLLLETSERLDKPYFGDEELRSSLQKHLISLIENSFMGCGMEQKGMEHIVRENRALYECILSCLEQYPEAEFYGNREEESALLMLHFLAADERRILKATTGYSTVIICNNGVGTAKIASARIKQYFPQIRIITTTATRNAAREIQEEQPDFLISTIPFQHPNIPVIHVNTLPTEDDLKKIRQFLTGNARQNKRVPVSDLYSRVMDVIRATCEVRDAETLERQLLRLFPQEERSPELLDMLTEEVIQTGVQASDWEEAIRKSAEPLVRQGSVEGGYVDSMVQTVKKMGPYIVITKGIALPHAPSTDGVNRSCISLATLKEPVSFGNKMNDPVKLMICIATVNKKEHMREMSRLIQFISNKKAVQEVLEAKNEKEILRIVHQIRLQETDRRKT